MLVLVLGVLYAAFLQFYLGMTDTQEFLICTAVFVVVCMGVFASMVRVCRGPSTTYGYQALMLTIIVPWLIVGLAPMFHYLWPSKNAFLIVIFLVIGWGIFLYPTVWIMRQWFLQWRCSEKTMAQVVDNEASVIPEEGRDFEDMTPNLYHPILAFAVQGKTYRVTSNDGQSEPAPIGQAVQICYSPMNVACWMREADTAGQVAYALVFMFICMGLTLLGTGICFLLM